MAIAAVSLGGRVLRRLTMHTRLSRHRAFSATISVTYVCNLRCATCSVWQRGEADEEVELSAGELVAICRRLRAMGIREVTLVGAEPLMRRDIVDAIEGIRALGLEVVLITNATLVTEPRAERIVRAGVRMVAVSVDGIGERHDEIRGQPRVYQRAMAGIARLRAAKERLGSETPKIVLHATISRFNTDQLEELSGLSDSLGVEVSFQLATETPAAAVERARIDGTLIPGSDFIPKGDSFLPDEEGVERIRRFLAKPGILKKHPSLAILTMMSDDDLRHGRFPVRTCNTVGGMIFVDPYGAVLPCSHLVNSYGNIREKDLPDIWSGRERRQVVRCLRRKLPDICRHCCHHRRNLTLWQTARLMLKVVTN